MSEMQFVKRDVEVTETVVYKEQRFMRINQYCIDTNKNTVTWWGNGSMNFYEGKLGEELKNDLKKLDSYIDAFTDIEDHDFINELEDSYQKMTKKLK
jgi:hypothetical protein